MNEKSFDDEDDDQLNQATYEQEKEEENDRDDEEEEEEEEEDDSSEQAESNEQHSASVNESVSSGADEPMSDEQRQLYIEQKKIFDVFRNIEHDIDAMKSAQLEKEKAAASIRNERPSRETWAPQDPNTSSILNRRPMSYYDIYNQTKNNMLNNIKNSNSADNTAQISEINSTITNPPVTKLKKFNINLNNNKTETPDTSPKSNTFTNMSAVDCFLFNEELRRKEMLILEQNKHENERKNKLIRDLILSKNQHKSDILDKSNNNNNATSSGGGSILTSSPSSSYSSTSSVNVSSSSNQLNAQNNRIKRSFICNLCKKAASITERITLHGLVYHRSCIRCSKCNAIVKNAETFTKNSNQDKGITYHTDNNFYY